MTLPGKPNAIISLGVPMENHVRSQLDTEPSNSGSRDALVALSFKVPKSFKKRYQQAALNADMKLNELLAAMLDEWEKKGHPTQ